MADGMSKKGNGGMTDEAERRQVYRLEIRWDHEGTAAEARAAAQLVADQVGGEVTAVFDEVWEEI